MRRRYAAKVDETQAAVVAGLRMAGVKVFPIREPCDLLCRYWSGELKRFLWTPLEVKSLARTKVRKAVTRKDQPEQAAFLAENEVPIVTSPEEALLALSLLRL